MTGKLGCDKTGFGVACGVRDKEGSFVLKSLVMIVEGVYEDGDEDRYHLAGV